MAYLTLAEFKIFMVIPNQWVDAIEAVDPGFTDGQLATWSEWMDSRLRKRYQAPFAEPVSVTVKGWLARIVTVRVCMRRGVDPTDQQFAELKADDQAARDEIKEAADSDIGLFDLPLRSDAPVSGIALGTPRSYSEASPYVCLDTQEQRGRWEDLARGGTRQS